MSINEESSNVIDEERLNELLGTAISDLGGAVYAPLVVIGHRLGLYRGLAEGRPLTSSELAERTETAERYVREWLAAGAAGGYVTYDPETERYSLTPEQAAVLADEDSPAFVAGGFQSAIGIPKATAKVEAAFLDGSGVGWHEHDDHLFHGNEWFYRPSYAASLVSEWIPALDGAAAKLEQGALVADVGCGHGASTVVMAEAYPESTFVGIDYHEASIDVARTRAEEAGVADRVIFDTAMAKEFDGDAYDLVTMFDCLHDMGDPVGVAAHVLDVLADDGTWMIVEPFAGDRVEENFNPVGRVYYAASTMVCTPNALDQESGDVLGAQAGEARIREAVTEGGFTRFRRAIDTPVNIVFEAKP